MAALGTQAGEDFSGVVILWTVRSARVAVQALVHTFLWPWGTPWLGAIVLALAAIGGLLLLWRSPRSAVLLGVAFVPYAAFHLLFHEVVTVRYALPLLIPVAYLLVTAIDRRPTLMLPVAASALAVAGVVQAARPSWVYARDGSPAFRAFADVRPRVDGAADARSAVGMHAFVRRTAEWQGDVPGRRVLTARHGVEWLTAVEELRRALCTQDCRAA